MNSIEEMMGLWREMDGKLSSLIEENKALVSEIKKNKLKTCQEKLVRKYRAFIIIGAVCIPIMYLIIGINPFVVERYRWLTLIYFECFFLFEIFIDSYLMFRISQIDIYNETVSEICRKASRNWRTHKVGIMAGIPMACGAIVLYCLCMGVNREVIYGVVLGAIIGLGIGTNQFFKFKKNYDRMKSDE